ncbi:MAG: hypothetical protein ABFC12_07855 [Methanobacterium sp.]
MKNIVEAGSKVVKAHLKKPSGTLPDRLSKSGHRLFKEEQHRGTGI